jgi:glutathione synthase/RimK-type ligase-like ATP-grasp enzyme
MQVLFVRTRGTAPELRDNFPTVIDDLVDNVGLDSILWRWNTDRNFPDRLEINPIFPKVLSADKPRMRQLVAEAGVRIPPTFYTAEDARNHFTTSSAPLLWRPRSHHGGQFMTVVNSSDEVTQLGGYWSEILPKTREFRVYVLFGRILGIDEKIVNDPTQLAWNHSAGGVFQVLSWDSWPSALSYIATKVALLANQHFTAVDVIYYDHRFYFLETNLSPAMTTVYKVGLLHKAVEWLENETTRIGDLPPMFPHYPEVVKGYRHYIHPLHNLQKEV